MTNDNLQCEELHNYCKITPRHNTRLTDGKEPIGKYKEHPLNKIYGSSIPLAKFQKLARGIKVSVVAKAKMTMAGVLHDTTIFFPRLWE